ncbi:MAG TPA: GNAT family N-acetyltransferase [Pyrinomonadaceae bacterium]|nr:GNAT family N-acetyltransferase [Pyrinomonadaceae bacterium]
MNFQIRRSQQSDIPQILAMIREFAEFEKLLEYCEVTAESLHEVLFDEKAFVESLIVFSDETPIGYAIFFPYFASFRGQRGIYLEDIYLKPDYRRFGLGEKIIREIARIGKEKGCVRIDFQVLSHNKNARNFYQKLGAVEDKSETHFKFTDEAFQNL